MHHGVMGCKRMKVERGLRDALKWRSLKSYDLSHQPRTDLTRRMVTQTATKSEMGVQFYQASNNNGLGVSATGEANGDSVKNDPLGHVLMRGLCVSVLQRSHSCVPNLRQQLCCTQTIQR